MTTAYERTKAVIETRELLQLLASAPSTAPPSAIRQAALQLLRHYPLDVDLEISAAALPGVWAPLRR
ncbi:BPSL0761 family protein [Burkholderia vietnamiensis]|uniref:BPSL0761 family protein n=1 Tax=Burkholderia vietnamiensis TaxID=60552 RepID=UPI00299EEC9A|nr:BPSL0761 family protein [Burkholderia vietnamiensis]